MTDSNASDRKHSHFGASNAERWLNCPGSFSLCQGIPEPPSSKYAVEGTRAHDLAERLLRQPDDIQRWMQTRVIDEAGSYLKDYPREMVEHVLEYTARCWLELAAFDQTPKPPQHRVEQRLVFDDDLGMFGTADFLATGLKTGIPCGVIVDLKYGTGKPVKAEANPQLAYYATCLWKQSKLGLKFVKVVVYQPRVKNGITEVEYSESDLKLWHFTFFEGARRSVMQHLLNKPELNPGRHCWWCRAKAICPAQQAKRTKDAAADFADLD